MPTKPFLPIDVEFMNDDKIINAGPAAGWLFLAMLLQIKKLGTDGTITQPQMARLFVDKWPRHLETLIEQGLVLDISEPINTRKHLWVPSWHKWNLSKAERQQISEKARSAAKKRWSTNAGRNAGGNASRIAPGNPTAYANKSREENNSQTPMQLVDIMREIAANE
jgi:hypothetical protein